MLNFVFAMGVGVGKYLKDPQMFRSQYHLDIGLGEKYTSPLQDSLNPVRLDLTIDQMDAKNARSTGWVT